MDKSLDEIINDRQADKRFGNRHPRNNSRNSGGNRGNGRINKGWRGGRFNGPRGDRPEKLEGTVIKISNLHYELTEDDLRVGPLLRLRIVYDRTGRSEGIAFATFETKDDALEAIERFDGKKAANMKLSITLHTNQANELKKRLDNSSRSQGRSRGGDRQNASRSEPRKKTTEELDQELSNYMNGESNDPQEPHDTVDNVTSTEPTEPESEMNID